MLFETAEEKYPDLYEVAKAIANTTCFSINQHVTFQGMTTPYQAQCVLEMVIKILESRV